MGPVREEMNSAKPKSWSNEDKREEDHSPSSLGAVDKDKRGGAMGARVASGGGGSNAGELGSLPGCDKVSCSDESPEITEPWSLGGRTLTVADTWTGCKGSSGATSACG